MSAITPTEELHKIKHVVLVMNKKGGCGKTTAAEHLTAAFEAGGKKVSVLDADDGNHSYTRRNGLGAAKPISWNLDETSAEDFIADHLGDAEIVIIDFGANLQSSGAAILRFISALLWLLKERGAAILRAGVASPNSPGTDALMRELVADAGKQGDVVLIENDVDGSRSFPGLDDIDVAKVTMDQMPAGIVAIRLRRQERLIALYEKPSPRYQIATAALARATLQLASQEPFSTMVGEVGLARLAELSRAAPGPLYYSTNRPQLARDNVLASNAGVNAAMTTLLGCSDEDLAAAANVFRLAQNAYVTAVRDN